MFTDLFVKFLILFTLFIILINQVESKHKVKELLAHDYEQDMGPTLANDQPNLINVDLQIVNFRHLDEKELSFITDCFVYLEWIENRVNKKVLYEIFKSKSVITLPSNWLKILWIPSLYFKNGISGNLHTNLFENSYFVLRPITNGTHIIADEVKILMISRVSVKLLCDFDFKNFPHDINNCDIEFMSLSERTDTLKLIWNTFKISSRVYNPDFAIYNPRSTYCSPTYALGVYSCLRGSIDIKRFVKRYFLRRYFPTFLIVATSWVGFMVPVISYPARSCILTISLLSLITQQIQSQPVRSMYTISYNIWSNGCIGFVVLALIEYAWAIVHEEKKKLKKAEESGKKSDTDDSELKHKKFSLKYCPTCNDIDAYSRIVFPLGFGCFIILYILFVYFRN